MKIFVRFAVLAALLAPSTTFAQFASPTEQPGGPVAIGQVQAQRDDAGKVTILQAPAVSEQGGGLIQLKVFGWLEPYADALAQALIAAGFAWFMKTKYGQMLDDSSRDALKTYANNAASSLIADGFVKMDGKTVNVHSAALANEVNTAPDRIPDAMKRFGLTPGALAQKIVDAIPQVAVGAAMVAAAHAPDPVTVTAKDATVNTTGDVNISEKAPTPGLAPISGPPTAGVES